jgi:rod shape-determining protein MreB
MLSAFFPLLYIQISPDTITIRDVRKNLTIEEPAELAVSVVESVIQSVIGVGHGAQVAAANHPSGLVLRPFAHPRTLISEYLAAEALLKHLVVYTRMADSLEHQAFFKHLIARTLDWFRWKLPLKVVLHLRADPEGGFAKVEIRVFRELLLVTGCRALVIWQGSPLSDQALLSGEFPSDGQILDQIGK